MIGTSIDHFVTDHPTNPTPADMRARLRAGESLPPTILEWRTVRGRLWVEVVAYAVRDAAGEMIGFRGISRDVTERFEAAAALRESETRYRGLVESQGALIYRADLDGNLTFINEACRREVRVDRRAGQPRSISSATCIPTTSTRPRATLRTLAQRRALPARQPRAHAGGLALGRMGGMRDHRR